MVTNFDFEETENPNFIDMFKSDTINEKGEQEKGMYIKGKDVIYLDAPAIYPSRDTPLLTEAQDFAGAINELKKLSEEGGGEVWTRPADWPELGVPENNQIILLFSNLGRNAEISGSAYQNAEFYLQLRLRTYPDESSGGPAFSGETPFIVDYGNGHRVERTSELTPYNRWTEHYVYEDTGGIVLDNGLRVHIVKITVPDDAYFGYGNGNGILEAYFGKNIKFYMSFGAANTIQHIKMFDWIPTEKNCVHRDGYDGQFDLLYNLRCFETTIPFPRTYYGMFSSAYRLESIDLSSCTEIGRSSFASCYSLKSINAPNCTSVGDTAFYSCYSLEKVKFAENCTFGNQSFKYCDNLYPRPDGSTN